MNRRRFLTTAAGLAVAANVRADGASPVGLTRADLPTPALLVDLDAFEKNIRTMAEHCKAAGVGFRPHAKTHKCPEIAKRQVKAGALGVCAATVPEAEAMAAAGIRGVLLTSPIVDRRKIERMVKLAKDGGDVMLSVGHAREVDLLGEAAAAAKVTIPVLVDLDVGDRRTGIAPGEPALELGRLVDRTTTLKLRGLQAYAGLASHVVGFEKRAQVSQKAMQQAVDTRDLFAKHGLEAGILSGGSTGTYNIDSAIHGVTELQVGSYVFMDLSYQRIGGRGTENYDDFQHSLTVLTTVVNANAQDRVTIDAGTKALDTTVPIRAQAKDRLGITYSFGGDEFGILTAAAGMKLPGLGERLEFYVPHCDPTTNLHDRIYAMRGEKVEAVWEIAARRETKAGR